MKWRGDPPGWATEGKDARQREVRSDYAAWCDSHPEVAAEYEINGISVEEWDAADFYVEHGRIPLSVAQAQELGPEGCPLVSLTIYRPGCDFEEEPLLAWENSA